MPLNPFKKKTPKLSYHFVLEENEAVGLFAIPTQRLYRPHWIISPEGKEISYQVYYTKDAEQSDYDLHSAFDSLPIYKVKRRQFQYWLACKEDLWFFSGFWGFIVLALCSSILVGAILVFGVDMTDNIYSQIVYYVSSFFTLFGGIMIYVASKIDQRLNRLIYTKEYHERR